MTTPVLSDMTFQFKDDGVLLNSDFMPTQPFVDIDKVQGLDSATYRTSSKDIEGQHGSIVEAEFTSKRTIVISGRVFGGTYDAIEPFIDALKGNFAPSRTAFPLYFKAPGTAQRLVYCKCTTGLRCDWDSLRRIAVGDFSVTFEAGDTIIYGSNLIDYSASLHVLPIPGFSFPFAFPFDFGAVEPEVTGSISIPQGGNREAPFVATFTGDGATNIGLQHEELNTRVVTDLSLNLGDVVVIDFKTEQVTFNGVPRRGNVTQEGWFFLQPDMTNHVRLLSSSGDASVIVSTRDAWW